MSEDRYRHERGQVVPVSGRRQLSVVAVTSVVIAVNFSRRRQLHLGRRVIFTSVITVNPYLSRRRHSSRPRYYDRHRHSGG